MNPAQADPFGTAALRESVLAAWRGSPTRFREDANAEEDLRLGGYRDRLLVELAQNASDAAGDEPGVLRLSVVGDELRAANTGAPLDAAGVAALASLRASSKAAGAVGQFGVGFAAVLAVTDAPRVVSRTGGVAFSAERTRAEVPDLAAGRGGDVPVLRLVWPTDEADLPGGFDTEVRLPLRAGAAGLLDGFAAQAPDLLLALPGLRRVEVGDRVWERVEADGVVELTGPAGVRRWLVRRTGGELPAELVAGVESRPRWSVCWAWPLDEPLSGDVLHAPTPTDEKLSLPARLIATLPVEPSRRRVLTGPAASFVLDRAAEAYPELVAALPAVERTALVPLPGFPLSEVDGLLRAGVLAALRRAVWLPLADGGWAAPVAAKVLDVASFELVELLEDVVPGLLDYELTLPRHARALAALEVPRVPVAEVVEALAGVGGDPSWWRQVYEALSPVADVDSAAREAMGALPVPLVDGRLVSSPRGVLVGEELPAVPGLRVAHPEASHPLLLRLGATEATPAELLDSDAVRDAVRHSLDDPGVDGPELVATVLRLVERAGGRPWLAELALPAADGGWRRADELVLPDSKLLAVLEPDSPFGVLSAGLAGEWPREVLTAVGVVDGFGVVEDDSPTEPDHDLADEGYWWDAFDVPPARVLGVRDLDLVAHDKWPRALAMMAADPVVWRAVTEPDGYTSWWLARYATLDGVPLGAWRLPGADDLEGLYDVVPDVGLPEHVLAAAGVRASLDVADEDDVTDLLARLGDPARKLSDALVLRVHALLAEVAGSVGVEPPDRVRVLTGAAVPADDVLVPDLPWLLGVLPPDQVLASRGSAAALAELLALPLASEEVSGSVVGSGDEVVWSELGAVRLACDLLGVELPTGSVVVHDDLVVAAEGAEHEVSWWVEDDVVHAADTPEGLARALAWTTSRWDDRHTFAALIADPTPAVLLG
ncbi:sacsin N-terminal ATP-binding-like domain-containing protein [Saccharothrix syringae]|uniref:ATP-binding protein n=1 Tax=Saccharothrix syringae TaxID=103733 RepID=A0A5Q0GSK6_SACSY|nr:ATP-binding protein [Saccharothrix syringae]QFZ16490.1 ATP-binding protein [Saccharothrix syringae]